MTSVTASSSAAQSKAAKVAPKAKVDGGDRYWWDGDWGEKWEPKKKKRKKKYTPEEWEELLEQNLVKKMRGLQLRVREDQRNQTNRLRDQGSAQASI